MYQEHYSDPAFQKLYYELFKATYHHATPKWLNGLPRDEITTYTETSTGNIAVTPGFSPSRQHKPNSGADAIGLKFSYSTDYPGEKGTFHRYIIFDLRPPTHSQLLALLNLFANDSDTSYNTSTDIYTAVLSASEAMRSATGISPVANPALRTLLIVRAMQGWSYLVTVTRPSAETTAVVDGYAALVRYLARAGGPDGSSGLEDLRAYMVRGNECGPWLSGGVEAALVKGGWRGFDLRLFGFCLGEDSKRGCGDGVDGGGDGRLDTEAGWRELVDVMRESGFLESRRGREQALQAVANYGTAEMMRYVFESGIPVGSVSKRCLCVVLSCAGGYPGGMDRQRWVPGRAPGLLRFLLGIKEADGVTEVFDSNMYNYRGNPPKGYFRNELPLHRVMKYGGPDAAELVEIVRILLEHGAKMVRDVNGVTPLQMAEKYEKTDAIASGQIVGLLEAWLQERGLPRGHVDEVNVAEEDEMDEEE